MAFVTTEDRVDRLEALFGQFITEMAVLNKKADERNKAADERMARLETEMREFKDEMRVFKDEMSDFKDEMRVFKDGMSDFKDEMRVFKDEMSDFKDEMRVFKDEMSDFKDEMRVFKDEMSDFKDEMSDFKDEMKQSRRDLDKKWGDLANKMGTIVEDILAPNIKRLSVEHFGFNGVDMRLRWNRQKPNKKDWEEFDLVAIGPDAVIAAEAKSSMNMESAEKVAAKMAGFSKYAPEFARLKLIPIVGCWSIPPAVVKRLTEHGIYAMQMGEETMQLSNAPELDKKYLRKK